jgi:hypothetical protein
MNLHNSRGRPYKLDPQAIERRKKIREVEHNRELKRLVREVWD